MKGRKTTMKKKKCSGSEYKTAKRPPSSFYQPKQRLLDLDAFSYGVTINYVYPQTKKLGKRKHPLKQVKAYFRPHGLSFVWKQHERWTKGPVCRPLFPPYRCRECTFYAPITRKEVCTLLGYNPV